MDGWMDNGCKVASRDWAQACKQKQEPRSSPKKSQYVNSHSRISGKTRKIPHASVRHMRREALASASPSDSLGCQSRMTMRHLTSPASLPDADSANQSEPEPRHSQKSSAPASIELELSSGWTEDPLRACTLNAIEGTLLLRFHPMTCTPPCNPKPQTSPNYKRPQTRNPNTDYLDPKSM